MDACLFTGERMSRPNGAGKTTTIRILIGISSLTSGTATIFGHDIEHDTIAERQSMGIVSENSNVYDDLTAWQNMIFSAELYHVARNQREKKTNELLTIFGLHGRRNEKVHGFSKGMKRRLTIAMGLVNSPHLLFLDEPTSGLDVQSNLIIRDVVMDLVREGVTVFLTTHNIEEANVMCDRVESMPSIDHEGRTKGIFRELSAARAIARKDMRIYYFKPNIIVSGILFPLFMFLAFSIGKNASPGTLIPAWCCCSSS
jgi:ABC-type Na+ transport system ATPase subunit NatA